MKKTMFTFAIIASASLAFGQAKPTTKPTNTDKPQLMRVMAGLDRPVELTHEEVDSLARVGKVLYPNCCVIVPYHRDSLGRTIPKKQKTEELVVPKKALIFK
jgi:hypothetical protein